MKSILVISFTFLVLVSTQKCPEFQSVIPLNPLTTSSNFSFAVVSVGKYYLIGRHHMNDSFNDTQTHIESGFMPKGFEDSRLITVVDRFHCNESDYQLIAIKVLFEVIIHFIIYFSIFSPSTT